MTSPSTIIAALGGGGGGGAAGVGNAIGVGGSSGSGSSGPPQPARNIDVEILGASDMKPQAKTEIATKANKKLLPVLQWVPPVTYRVVAVDLPILVVRELTSAAYYRRIKGDAAPVGSTTSARNAALRKELEALLTEFCSGPRRKATTLYIFSATDNVFDVMVYFESR
jgi:hypothetical protein